MATLHAEVQDRIEDITAFMSIMTGGVWTSDDIDTLDGGGWTWAVDNGLVVSNRLVPHSIMRWKDSTPRQSNAPVLGAELESLEVFGYAPLGGYASLETAFNALKIGLHHTEFRTDDRYIVKCQFAFLSGEMPAEEYMMSPSRFMRFGFIHIRR
jgi:hypothetical protein